MKLFKTLYYSYLLYQYRKKKINIWIEHGSFPKHDLIISSKGYTNTRRGFTTYEQALETGIKEISTYLNKNNTSFFNIIQILFTIISILLIYILYLYITTL